MLIWPVQRDWAVLPEAAVTVTATAIVGVLAALVARPGPVPLPDGWRG